MNEKIFSGLEEMGFENTKELNLYEKKEALNKDKNKNKNTSQQIDIESLLYNKEVTCPVCGNKFKAKAVKTAAYRKLKEDSDLFIRYSLINPYFYDVWLCNVCGYAAPKSDFEKIRTMEIELIQQKVAPKWQGRRYPDVYDVNIAIERYKLALLNSVLMEAKSSKKAMICLKIAWMYRLIETKEAHEIELTFLTQALQGFDDAYINETLTDEFTIAYLLGEINRRIGNNDKALNWFSTIIASPFVKASLKDKARDQKDLIKEGNPDLYNSSVEAEPNDNDEDEDLDVEDPSYNEKNEPKKQGFFSKFFK